MRKTEGVDKAFEAWWLILINREPNFSEYLKIKRICREAFLAGAICPYGAGGELLDGAVGNPL